MYGPENTISNEYELAPAPMITITQNNLYANDVIIGYNYTVNLDGYAIDKTLDLNIQRVLDRIEKTKKILSHNGSALTISNEDGNLIVLKGGFLKSLSFNSTDNSWTTYAKYNAEIEFKELVLLNSNITCSNGLIDSRSITEDLVDINKYKIQSFTDNWSFGLEDEALNYIYIRNYPDPDIKIKNSIINLSYTLNATGQTYVQDDQILPAWIQAKNFAQKRLYDQINNLQNALKFSPSGCAPDNCLDAIHSLNSVGSGLINQITNQYALYDETIKCDASESAGTFGLIYNAKLKSIETSDFASDGTIHTFTKDITVGSEGTKSNVTISINGTIQGLCAGGLVSSSGNFILPASGSLLIGPKHINRYNNADQLLSKIIVDDDLKGTFKTALGISYNALLASSGSCSGIDNIKPASFNLTKNYMDGTITYSVQYSTDRTCVPSPGVSKTSIEVELPVDIICDFAVPGGNYVLQDIKTKTARKVTITIEGKKDKFCCMNNINTELYSIVSNSLEYWLPVNASVPLIDYTKHIETQKELNYNPMDGSFVATLGYICSKSCPILP